MKRFIAVVFLLLPLVAAGCSKKAKADRRTYETARVERRDIEVAASATGVVEPTRIVEVKSKSSGEVIALPVDTGDYVETGAVLARLYPRDAENQVAQARADVEAARARMMTAESEFRRTTQLRDAKLLPESIYEEKRLELANARAQLVRAQTNLEIAAERLRETVVIAPVSGRIIEKGVELGNVVSSAVSQVSGGTTLMKMADLREVQIRAMVDETDIGKVQQAQSVRIKVDAFPSRQFPGKIYKIEPRAVVEQNVTMFPVLVRIQNDDELLKPGMNAEIDIFIERHRAVLSVPNEAIKTPREAVVAGRSIGLTPEEVRAALGGGGGGGAQPAGPTAAGAPKRKEGGSRPQGARREGGGPPGASAGGPGRERGNSAIVFKLADGKPVPVRITTGSSNWDFTQVTSGLTEEDTVIVLPSTSLIQQQERFRERMRGNSGVPGMGGSGGGGRR
jgi:HlyD family secretion protein